MARSRFDNPSYYNSLKAEPSTSSYGYRADLGARPTYSSQRQPTTSYSCRSDRSARPNASYSSSSTQPSYSYRSDRSARPSESSYDRETPKSQSYSSYSRYAPRTSRTSLVNTTNTNWAGGTHQNSSYGNESWMKRSQAVPEEPQQAPLELCAIGHEEQVAGNSEVHVAGNSEVQQLRHPELICQEGQEPPRDSSPTQQAESLLSPRSKAAMRTLEDLSQKLAIHEAKVN